MNNYLGDDQLMKARPERAEHAGHRIELRDVDGRLELRIDDVLVPYGELPDGRYYLDQYAYDWTDDLMELARRYIDYRHKADKIREETKARRRRAKGDA
jgi:hypothetical protein